ncbi:MAG: glycosyltransferase family 1 protein [Myxacorys californica WJT36-NPBG1]|jgi:UDP-galactopyranose mutase|nr:glycosyltransferase family 1 protein [Myxacorys californica WJT36-NPBG1]
MAQSEQLSANYGSSTAPIRLFPNRASQSEKSDCDVSDLEQASLKTLKNTSDLVCFSHLRWDFVYQRPQHLLTRCTQERRTFFIEEPVFESSASWWLEVSRRECGVWVGVPHLPHGMSEEMLAAMQQSLVDELFTEFAIANPMLWYYNPLALSFTNHLEPVYVVYDCMDELTAFKGASATLKNWEAQLFKRADVVFTGGQSLYEAKQHQHSNIHPFPSSIDVAHFAQAKGIADDPPDQACIAHPRLGFYGVIDERMDLDLLDGIAQARPDWQLVMIGPVVKVDADSLPRRPNIHYLGGKSYLELPRYLAGWDVALLPFALNESTRFISPTKTPEYLAAGKPVVSTSIRDVVRPYGHQNLVHIADSVEEFVEKAEIAMQQNQHVSCEVQLRAYQDWRTRVDAFLSQTSWDETWASMMRLIEAAIQNRASASEAMSPILEKF